ncbi:preprotein translocase subunit YajC [Streptomonospora litoralis]|uniref:Preprotein translocase subunit YajC n=1 Tax=Streptomonospora litoralis TaxID=2498135 RepID=A0A4V0ZJY6_9ACTN|nr:preprotein translocase subunit YajC [Streptomonospora litoralis]QBI55112.1 preprotein translocase subunit YajC [Streptomonospora litoralis]
MEGHPVLAQTILAEGAQGSGGLLGMLLPFVLIALVFWLLILRPQQKRKQQETRMQSELQPGVEVLTKAGFYATVVEVRDSEVELEISPGTRIRMLKAGVGDIQRPDSMKDDTPVEDRPDFPGKDDKDDGSK